MGDAILAHGLNALYDACCMVERRNVGWIIEVDVKSEHGPVGVSECAPIRVLIAGAG